MMFGVLTVLGFFSTHLSHIISFMYPVIKTWKAVNNENTEETNQWLYFWTIYSLIYIFETVFFFVVWWVWFYYEIKLVFIFWLSLPTSHGAKTIFDKVIFPVLTYNEENIDGWVARVAPYLKTVAMKTFRRGSAYAIRRGTEMIEETQGDNAEATIGLIKVLASATSAGKAVKSAMAAEEESPPQKSKIPDNPQDATPTSEEKSSKKRRGGKQKKGSIGGSSTKWKDSSSAGLSSPAPAKSEASPTVSRTVAAAMKAEEKTGYKTEEKVGVGEQKKANEEKGLYKAEDNKSAEDKSVDAKSVGKNVDEGKNKNKVNSLLSEVDSLLGSNVTTRRQGTRSSSSKLEASVTASVDDSVKSDGVTLYLVKVNITATSDTVNLDESWVVNRRYSEFDAFYRQIVHDIRDTPFPGKSLMPDTDERQCKLDAFLSKMCGQKAMSSSTQKKLAKFLDIYDRCGKEGISRSTLLWPLPGEIR